MINKLLIFGIIGSAGLATAITAAAYGLEIVFFFDADEERDRALVSEAMNVIQNQINSSNFGDDDGPSISLTDQGTMTISFDNGTAFNSADDIRITVPHKYTPQNGYTFEDNQVLGPDGEVLFP